MKRKPIHNAVVSQDDGYPRAWCSYCNNWIGPKRRKDRIGGWTNPDRPGKKAAENDCTTHNNERN